MNATEQLQYESRVRPRYAALALAAGILLVLSAVIQLSGPHTNVDELTLDLITAHKRFPIDIVGAAVDCIGLLALAGMLAWLHRVSQARNPQIRDFIRWLAISGAILSGAMAVAYAVVIAAKANQFVSSGDQSFPQASSLTSGGIITVLPLLAQLGSLLLTAGFIWASLNGMRVGLLTRFMGYLGVFAGILVLFPIGSPVPVVQGFWLVAMAVLLAGRWPSGMPPAWEQGIAVPWAPMAQPREGRARGGQARGGQARGGQPQRPARRGRPEPPAGPSGRTPGQEALPAAPSRANTPKRKRKRRK